MNRSSFPSHTESKHERFPYYTMRGIWAGEGEYSTKVGTTQSNNRETEKERYGHRNIATTIALKKSSCTIENKETETKTATDIHLLRETLHRR